MSSAVTPAHSEQGSGPEFWPGWPRHGNYLICTWLHRRSPQLATPLAVIANMQWVCEYLKMMQVLFFLIR